LTLSATSTGSVSKLTSVVQGVGVRQREGDALEIESMVFNYDLDAINADIFTTTRLIIFQWIPSDSLVVPTITNVLQSASTLSMYNWEQSRNYRILLDKTWSQVGITAAPCDSGFQAETGVVVPVEKGFRKITFQPAVTTSANAIYALLVSNSLIAPFPNFNAQFRMVFKD